MPLTPGDVAGVGKSLLVFRRRGSRKRMLRRWRSRGCLRLGGPPLQPLEDLVTCWRRLEAPAAGSLDEAVAAQPGGEGVGRAAPPVQAFEDPWVRQMMRAHAEGFNRLHFGEDWPHPKRPWWRRLLAKGS